MIRRALLLAVAALLAKIAQLLVVWKRNHDLLLKSGLPTSSQSEFNSPFGSFFAFVKNLDRIYDFKVERQQGLSPPALTYTIASPFFNPGPAVGTVDPVVVKHFLRDRFDIYVKSKVVTRSLQELVGNGLFGIDHGPYSEDGGASWTLQRKTASKVFTNNNFNTKMFSSFAKHALIVGQVLDERLKQQNGKAKIELQEIMFQYTLDSIGEVGFGVELHSLTKPLAFSQAFDRAQEICMLRFSSPFWYTWWGRWFYRTERELPSQLKTMNDFMAQIIQQKRQSKIQEDDILSLFIQEKLGLTDEELRDVVFTFMIAGRDTTACTLSFTLLLLAKHPHWQQTLLNEIQQFRQQQDERCEDKVLSSKQLAGLKNVQAVIMESLRLYPPVPTDVKESCEDDVLPGGFAIPKGTRIAFEPYMMARTPQIWGEDCLEFKPERWLEMKTLPSPYTFPVFQAGPRICLGESMAKFEAELMLVFLVERYEFALPQGVPVESLTYQPGITLKVKNGLWLDVKKRNE
ncbi:hypothetical protein BASA81_009882 [Batrachochytrium salamandrivorans]|nr:hypothetical protein BASA81_009882 [Batrachochytrium salamandrivorans]